MYSFLSGFLIVFVLAAPTAVVAQITSEKPFPSSKVDRNKKKYSVSIKRAFRNAEEEALLRIAENTHPSEAEVGKKCDKDREYPNTIKPAGMRWWCTQFDGVFMPYAVTRDAVEYYLTVTDEFRQNNFIRTHKLRMEETTFSYSAEINIRTKAVILGKVFTDVYEVRMTLSWGQYCGNLCAMSISGSRTVVLDKRGVILFMTGDGDSQGMVS
jgi:hypothetical protein